MTHWYTVANQFFKQLAYNYLLDTYEVLCYRLLANDPVLKLPQVSLGGGYVLRQCAYLRQMLHSDHLCNLRIKYIVLIYSPTRLSGILISSSTTSD